jgi:hypothetical protein
MVQTAASEMSDPVLIPTRDGAWLAVSAPGARFGVGALEATRDEARLRFQEAHDRAAAAFDRRD